MASSTRLIAPSIALSRLSLSNLRSVGGSPDNTSSPLGGGCR
jgi:hypothetical protein